MLELLERMHEHYFTTGIVTASHREHFDLVHELSGMLEHVDFAVVREDYLKAKPYLTATLQASSGLASPRGVA
jgi:hypothetical protein